MPDPEARDAMTECNRIADQLRRAFTGDPWHGPPILELLAEVTAEQAFERSLPSAHTIWELVVHIDLYVHAAIAAMQGAPMPRWYETGADWPQVIDTSAHAWAATTNGLFSNAERLAQTIESSTDTKLQDAVPGREYDFYYLLQGIVQHSLYHAGQIALLKKLKHRE
jgi:uncharacterized damage-inducible protein DinB